MNRNKVKDMMTSQGGKGFNPGSSGELETKGFKQGMVLDLETRGFLPGNANDLPKDRAAIFDKLYEGGKSVGKLVIQEGVKTLIKSALENTH